MYKMLRIIITIAIVFFLVYPVSAEVDYKQAIEIVKKLPSSEGGNFFPTRQNFR